MYMPPEDNYLCCSANVEKAFDNSDASDTASTTIIRWEEKKLLTGQVFVGRGSSVRDDVNLYVAPCCGFKEVYEVRYQLGKSGQECILTGVRKSIKQYQTMINLHCGKRSRKRGFGDIKCHHPN